jgi:hypothetical protein
MEGSVDQGTVWVSPSCHFRPSNRVGRITAVHPLQVRRLCDQQVALNLRFPAPISTPPQAFFKGLLEADFGRGAWRHQE